MDFRHDALADGRTLRVLTIVDTYTREYLAPTQQPALCPDPWTYLQSAAAPAPGCWRGELRSPMAT